MCSSDLPMTKQLLFLRATNERVGSIPKNGRGDPCDANYQQYRQVGLGNTHDGELRLREQPGNSKHRDEGDNLLG